MRYLNVKLNHFWKRWRKEYLVELRNAHRHSPITHGHGVAREIRVGEVVMVHDDDLPRGQWKLATIKSLFRGIDGLVRSASVRTLSPGGQVTILNRPIQSYTHWKSSQVLRWTLLKQATPQVPLCQ